MLPAEDGRPYRGLGKNTQRIALLLGFANLLIVRPPCDGMTRSRTVWRPPTSGGTGCDTGQIRRLTNGNATTRAWDRIATTNEPSR